jgi:DNA (cytosine-5)-methyltransferase 1
MPMISRNKTIGVLKHLDLFSGIGGFSLSAQWVGGIQTAQFVESDPFCQKVLSQNFPRTPIHEEIKTFTAHRGEYDLISAGFPCQDLSVAGQKKGIREGTRSGLFFEIIRIICECRPRYLVLENVAALLHSNRGRDMGTVLWELSECGYDAEWQTISAKALGANHARDRLWIVAYPNSIGYEIAKWEECGAIQEWGMVSTDTKREVLRSDYERNELSRSPRFGDLSRIPRANDGLPDGLDVAERLKALGNSIVPHCAEIPLRRILEIEMKMNCEKRSVSI